MALQHLSGRFLGWGTSDWFGLGGQASGCAFCFLSFAPSPWTRSGEHGFWVAWFSVCGLQAVIPLRSFGLGGLDGMLFSGRDGAMGTVSSGETEYLSRRLGPRQREMVYSSLRSSRKCISRHLTKMIAHERIEKRFIYFAMYGVCPMLTCRDVEKS